MAGALERLRGQIAPITAITLFGLSMSMSYPLFGLLLERMGHSGVAIGLNQTGPAIAIVLFAPVMPVLAGRLGVMRLLLLATLMLAAALVAVPLWQDFWYWAALRVTIGFAATALFYASEYWIVGAAPDGRRGRVIAVYTISVSCAFLVGPMLLNLIGVGPVVPFLVAAAVVLAGVGPLLWGRGHAPVPATGERARLFGALGFYRSDPSVIWGVTLFGAIEFGALGLVSVWAVRSGMSESGAVALLALFALGAIVFPLPTGWAADRVEPARLLPLAGAACAAMPLVMLWAAPAFWLLVVPVVVWGGVATALYSLALTEMGARYRGVRLSEATAGVNLGYGWGALVGPLAFVAAMDLVPPDGVLWLVALVALVYAGLVLARRRAAAEAS